VQPQTDNSLSKPLTIFLWLVILCLVLGLLSFLRPVLVWALNVSSPFFVGLIIAYIFNPLVRFIERRMQVSRTIGVLLTYGMILGLLALFVIMLMPILVAQLRLGIGNILERIPVVIALISERLHMQIAPEDIERLRNALEGRLSWEAVANQVAPWLRSILNEIASTVTSVTQTVAAIVTYSLGVVAFLVLVLMITFYCLIDFGRIASIVGKVVPPAYRERFFSVWSSIDEALGGFLRGQLIVCVIIGILYSIALMALGMKQYALLIGFAAGFGNLIPYVGPVIGAIPTILWIVFGNAYDTSTSKILGIGIVLGVSVAIQTLDGFFLQPRIVGKSAGLHPLVVLAALIIGAQFGLGGLILAVPVAIVIRVLVRELWWTPLLARRAQESEQEKDGNPKKEK
jgi:predicted PurR-regulated permease PerM